jgi:excisionase family DNA binding protein
MSLVSVREAARALRLSERHIRRMISEARWPFYRLGQRIVRVDIEEIKNLGRLIAEAKPVADEEGRSVNTPAGRDGR